MIDSRPKLLDLFSGAGGAAMGYYRAGFDVTGVDHVPQPRYPFRFVECDAFSYISAHGHEYQVIHASPPCQEYSVLRHIRTNKDRQYPDLLDTVRRELINSGRPYIIENVPRSPIHRMILLCGSMFGLHVYRHRWFETTLPLFAHAHYGHTRRCWPQNRRGSGPDDILTVTGNCSSRLSSVAMGIDWMTGRELSQAIPPAYTYFLGTQAKNLM